LVPALDGGDDAVGICGPGEELWIIVFLGEDAVGRGLEIDDGAEDAAFNRRRESLTKKLSTALTQEHEVGVKWKMKRSCRSSQARTFRCLWAA
jgi:hypothetical protein